MWKSKSVFHLIKSMEVCRMKRFDELQHSVGAQIEFESSNWEWTIVLFIYMFYMFYAQGGWWEMAGKSPWWSFAEWCKMMKVVCNSNQSKWEKGLEMKTDQAASVTTTGTELLKDIKTLKINFLVGRGLRQYAPFRHIFRTKSILCAWVCECLSTVRH